MKQDESGQVRSFLKSGHPKTLFSAFMYFDVSFMVWMLIGALSILIAEDLHLSPFRKGLLVAVPLLGGAFFRIILGLLSDRFGPKRVGMVSLAIVFVPLVWGWLGGHSFPALLGIGLLLGIAGASFAVALPLASRWYPPESQGIAMGIAGAGNSGTLFAIFLAPYLAVTFHFGWHGVFGLAMIPVAITLFLFWKLAKEAPGIAPSQGISSYIEILKVPDLWLFCLFYGTTFGGFVGLTSYLNLFYHDHYQMSAVTAGRLTGLGVLLGSFFRPVGGYLADRMGGLRLLGILYAVATVSFTLFGWFTPPAIEGMALVSLGILALGMGNGAVFQLVPQRFSKQIGAVSGIVGAAGGIGGFLLPTLFGTLHEFFHMEGAGFMLFSLMTMSCSTLIYFKAQGLNARWIAEMPASAVLPELEGGMGSMRVQMEVVFGG